MMNENPIPRLPKEALEEFGVIAKLAHKLPALLPLSDSIASALSMKEVKTIISNTGVFTAEDIETVLQTLVNLHAFRQWTKRSAEDFIDELTTRIRQDPPIEWRNEFLADWENACDSLKVLLNPDNPIAIHQKAIQLANTHGAVLGSASVITDVRPVFTDAADKVLRMVISHVLSITYTENNLQQQMYFTLDSNDVANLLSQLQRAELKAEVLQNSCKKCWPIWVWGS